MLAAQVNARKHENLRIILGFEWSGGLCLCEALLWWVVIAVAAAGRGFGLIWVDYPPPLFACWPELMVTLALRADRSSVGSSLAGARSGSGLAGSVTSTDREHAASAKTVTM